MKFQFNAFQVVLWEHTWLSGNSFHRCHVVYLETNAKCCRNLVKIFKIMLTLTFEANIKDSLPKWERATPINGSSFARLAETLLGRYLPCHLSCFSKNINLLYFILAIWRIIVLFLQDVRKKAQAIQKQNTAPHVLSRGGYEYLEQKLLAAKTKKKLEEAAQSGSVDGIIDPPSLVRRHVKWKMVRTKKTG